MKESANVWVPILVALVTGLVTVITVFLTGRGNLKLEREKFAANSKLERQKFEASLVLQAIATGERETAQKNLQFLVGAGFLPDPSGRIRDLETRPADVPVLPARRVAQSMPHAPVFRWSVRTGADPDASRVQDTPVRTTVEELAAQPRPTNMKAPTEAYPAYQERRAEGVETTIYEIEAVIVSHKLQTSGSYHLTLRGKSGQTMIANCVEPRLVGPTNRWAKQITTVRREVEQTLDPKTVYARGNWPVRITGIGFFNQVHGQVGVAPNGVELTPVLGIKWQSSSKNDRSA